MHDEAIAAAGTLRAVRALARRTGIDEGLALEVFEHERKRLDSEAKVHRYVPLIAEKHVRRILVGA